LIYGYFISKIGDAHPCFYPIKEELILSLDGADGAASLSPNNPPFIRTILSRREIRRNGIIILPMPVVEPT
jgi:hypothetical protein